MEKPIFVRNIEECKIFGVELVNRINITENSFILRKVYSRIFIRYKTSGKYVLFVNV